MMNYLIDEICSGCISKYNDLPDECRNRINQIKIEDYDSDIYFMNNIQLNVLIFICIKRGFWKLIKNIISIENYKILDKVDDITLYQCHPTNEYDGFTVSVSDLDIYLYDLTGEYIMDIYSNKITEEFIEIIDILLNKKIIQLSNIHVKYNFLNDLIYESFDNPINEMQEKFLSMIYKNCDIGHNFDQILQYHNNDIIKIYQYKNAWLILETLAYMKVSEAQHLCNLRDRINYLINENIKQNIIKITISSTNIIYCSKILFI